MLGIEALIQNGGEITLTKACQNYDDSRTSKLRTLRQLHRRMRGRAGRDSSQDSFFCAQATGHIDSLLTGHVEDLVIDLTVQDGWHKIGTNPLDFVGARFS